MSIRPIAAALCVFVTLVAGTRPAWAQTSGDGNGVNATTAPAPSTRRALTPPHFKDLFTPLGNDFKRLTTRPDFWVLGVGVAGTFAAHSFDDRLARAQWGDAAGTALAPGRVVGSFVAQTGAALATYAIGRAAGKPGLATVGAELFRAQMVAQGMTQAIKFTSHRTRPDGTAMSFPSGHAAAAFATATVLQGHYGWKAGLPAYAMAGWVAASRVQTGRHYLSDVVAGATLGILAGRAITVGRGSAKFGVAPMAAPGGVGVSFTRIVKK
jgi:membrane-associated phospholipid phosphatase